MRKFFWFLMVAAFPLLLLASDAAVAVSEPGLGLIQKITGALDAHTNAILIIGGAVMEVVLRLIPSTKFRSILVYVAKLLLALSALMFKLSDLLSKLVPDLRPPKPEEVKAG